MSATNGARRASLETLGAPEWYLEGERHHDERYSDMDSRIGRLETAMVSGASIAGARAGQKWGAFLGALLAVLSTTVLNQCDSRKTPQNTGQSP